MAQNRKSPVKAISLMMVITLLGKVSGLIRDRLLTVNYGTGMAANAFLTASRIPRVFFDAVFASAITASFIPVFNEYMVKKGKNEAYAFSGNFITVIGLVSVVLTGLGMMFSGGLTSLFAGGFDSETARLCSELTRIMFPTVFFTGIAYSFVGILQSLDEFNLPAAMSLVSNAAVILYYFTLNDRFGVVGLAFAFLAAWLLQALIMVPSLAKKGFRYRPSLNLKSDGMKKVFALMLPVMVSTWVTPINQTINARFGSGLFEGAGVSAIELSYNLYTIIVGVFILSITNYIFPRLSQISADKDGAGFKDVISRTMHISMYFVVPMMAGIMVLSRQIVGFIYGGGEFGEFSVEITSRALFFLCTGMIGYAVQAVLSRAFFAEQRGRIPLIAGVISIAVNIVLCFLLAPEFDVAGLAVASAASGTVNAAVLLIFAQRGRAAFVDRRFMADVAKMAVSAIVMAAAVGFAASAVERVFGKLLSLCIPTAVGVAVYYIMTLALGVSESKMAIDFAKAKLKGR